jgi:hypothetical protein
MRYAAIFVVYLLIFPIAAVAQTVGRYQIVIFQPGILQQQSALLLDTATGETWILAQEAGPDGKSTTRLSWFALDRNNAPAPIFPRPVAPTGTR